MQRQNYKTGQIGQLVSYFLHSCILNIFFHLSYSLSIRCEKHISSMEYFLILQNVKSNQKHQMDWTFSK